MKFCPSCEARLKKSDSGLECPKCGHVQKGGGTDTPKPQAAGGPETDPATSAFNVLDGNEEETLPTIKADCEKCGHNEAVWWMLQTRSADEATTQFYRCTECSHTWRNYD